MILVGVGASEYGLDRLLQYLDELCEEKVLNGNDLIAQIGSAKYEPKNYQYFRLIGREEYEKYVDEAEFIITHAGTGSVVPALKKNKKIIVFPRLKKYNEHLDNHQLELSECFTSMKYTLSAKNKSELKNAIESIKFFFPRKFNSNKDRFNELVIKCIEEI